MSKGRRYNGADENKKINIKKVIAVIITILVIAMFIVILKKAVNLNKNTSDKNIALLYYTVFQDDKWGVINSKGETVISPTYDEMIVIPNPEKAVFIITYDVNYENGEYSSKAVNSKNQQLFSNYDKVEYIQNQNKQNSIWYSTNCLKVEKNGKYGLIDLSGKQLLDCQYDDITPVANIKNSLVTLKDNKKGLVSDTGAIIINNEYEDILALTQEYEDGYIVKNSENKYGVIGTNKKIIVPIEYDSIKNVHSGSVYVVEKENSLSIFNSEENKSIPINYTGVKTADGDNIIVTKDNKYGLINTAGEQRIEPKYQNLTYAFANYYIAQLDDKYGIVNTSGETKVNFNYTNLIYRKDADFIEGQLAGKVESDLLDRNLTVKLTGIVSEVNVIEGYMKLRINNDYKYYNFKFEEKQNTEIFPDNTIFLSKKDGKYGYVNKDGIVVVNYIYDDATEENAFGYAAVKKDGKWGCIDFKGNTIVEPSLDMENNSVIKFIGAWHLSEDVNAGYYTK